MKNKLKVLFICQHNSGRSQIAEAYLRKFYGADIETESAGFEPSDAVNPMVVRVMKEEGIDLSGKTPRSVFELFKQGRLFDHIITVCQEGEALCPVFPGIAKRWHWPFPDPAEVQGSESERLGQVRQIRDRIRDWLLNPPEDTFNFKSLLE
jgi:arsenate reductase